MGEGVRGGRRRVGYPPIHHGANQVLLRAEAWAALPVFYVVEPESNSYVRFTDELFLSLTNAFAFLSLLFSPSP